MSYHFENRKELNLKINMLKFSAFTEVFNKLEVVTVPFANLAAATSWVSAIMYLSGTRTLNPRTYGFRVLEAPRVIIKVTTIL